MLNRSEKSIEIELEIKNILQEIKSQEEKTSADALVNQFGLYQKARETCNAAQELLNNNLSNIHKELQHEYILDVLKRIKRIVILPSLENADDLLTYRQNNLCNSDQNCHNDRKNKFWGAVKAVIGAAIYIGGLISCFLLPIPIPFIPFLVGGVIMLIGIALYKNGKAQYDISNENLKAKKHVHIPFNEIDRLNNQSFLSRLSIFSDTANTVGSIAETKFRRQETERKPNALYTLLKASP